MKSYKQNDKSSIFSGIPWRNGVAEDPFSRDDLSGHTSESIWAMEQQEKTGFAIQVLGDQLEDVWNDL